MDAVVGVHKCHRANTPYMQIYADILERQVSINHAIEDGEQNPEEGFRMSVNSKL